MKIDRLDAAAYRFPTPEPEADGTLVWTSTTAVVVRAWSGDLHGLGWTYSTAAAVAVVADELSGAVEGLAVDDVAGCFAQMRRTCRNLGTRGLVMQAISAVDIALWDLKARAHDTSVTDLLGRVRDEVRIYGSGGFLTMGDDAMLGQLEHWKEYGCRSAKIKIGGPTRIGRDLDRVRLIRETLPELELMVDANGAYRLGEAERMGLRLDELGVTWFEEPVSSDDLDGLAMLRGRLNCDVTAGEYLAEVCDAPPLVAAVDCLQLDVTRCGGYTGFLRAAAVADALQRDVSGHCAPALTVPVATAVSNLRHLEYFADHVRIEPLLVEGVPSVQHGELRPNTVVGNGYTLRPDVHRWKVAEAGFSSR